jgi:hypothetical protein
MADLVAIGYPDEATAEAAADEARRLAQDQRSTQVRVSAWQEGSIPASCQATAIIER